MSKRNAHFIDVLHHKAEQEASLQLEHIIIELPWGISMASNIKIDASPVIRPCFLCFRDKLQYGRCGFFGFSSANTR